MAISMLKIRRLLGRLIFNMGIAIPGKTVFLIETAPSFHSADQISIAPIACFRQKYCVMGMLNIMNVLQSWTFIQVFDIHFPVQASLQYLCC